MKRAAPAIERTHRGALTKAKMPAMVSRSCSSCWAIEEIKEMEQRMKIVMPGQIEQYELAQELFKLQNHKNRLARRLDQWKSKAEDDHDKVKALKKDVAEDRDNGCARYMTSRDRVSTSPDPGGRKSTALHPTLEEGIALHLRLVSVTLRIVALRPKKGHFD